MNLLAQTEESLGNIGGPGLGPFGRTPPTSGEAALIAVTRGVSAIIGIMTVAASIWFLFQLLIGALTWITAGGDKNNLENARNRITNAFVGLIIVVAGWSILALVGQFLGYDILIVNPGEFIPKLSL